MPKRISRDGSIVEPHAIKLEERYQRIFDKFFSKNNINKTDVIRNAIDSYFKQCFGVSPTNLYPSLDSEKNNLGHIVRQLENSEDKLYKIEKIIRSFLKTENKESFLKSIEKIKRDN
jgi:hypothetical protein